MRPIPFLCRQTARTILALLLCTTALADYPTAINPASVLVDKFDGWGTSLCWWAKVTGSYPNREAYADLAFKGLQLNIVRYNIGGGENPAIANTMEPRARLAGFEPTRDMWNWEADPYQRWMLRAAVSRGVNRVVAFANSPPHWMTVSGSVTGSGNGKSGNLRPECEGDFAIYLATVISNLTRLDQVKFDFVAPMNEPSGDWWRLGGRHEGNAMSPQQEVRVIGRLRQELDLRGLKTGIVASEDYDQQSVINSLNSYPADARKSVSLIATHTYSANNPAGLHELASALGKPLWISEYCDNDPSGLRLGRRIRDDLADSHAQAWIYWQFTENDPKWGMLYNAYDPKHTNFVVTKKYHVMAQFSRFIRPGFQLLQAGDHNSLAGYDATNHTLVIVSVNDSRRPITVAFDLNAFDSAGSEALRTRTSATENLATVDAVTVTDKRFISLLAPHSVTTHVISNTVAGKLPVVVNDNSTGTGLNQFEYLGAWQYYDQEPAAFQRDNHWTSRANDAYQVRFNGTQVRICASRGAVHGIAAVSVDNDQETFVDFYLPTRVDASLMWISPRLKPGAHTLRVRVTGTKNPASKGLVIPADRVEIIRD